MKIKLENLVFFMLLFSIINTYASYQVADTTKEHVKKTKSTLPAPTIVISPYAKDCEKIEAVTYIIEEAISVGAPAYNNGDHASCFLIYKGAAYRIMYLHGAKCKQVKNILETALEKTEGNYNVTEKAWIMRMAFDQILGEPTRTTK